MIDAGTSGGARCQNDMGSLISSPATRGHGFSYELSHCVIPKELLTAAAWPHVPRMWALDPAQRAARKGELQRGAGVSAWGRNRPGDLARQPVTQLLLATVLSGSGATKQGRESLIKSERESRRVGLHLSEPGTGSLVLLFSLLQPQIIRIVDSVLV